MNSYGASEGESMSSDAVSEATARLERAVGRLAMVLARQPAPAETAGPAVPGGVPPEAVAALSARLAETLVRLRGALAEIEGAESTAPPQDDEPGEDEPGDDSKGS